MLGITTAVSRGTQHGQARVRALCSGGEQVGSAPGSMRSTSGDSLAGRLRRAFTVVFIGIGITAMVSAAVFAYVFVKARPDAHRYTVAGEAARSAHAAMID